MIFDKFDYLGKPICRKEMICPHQFDNCEYKLPFSEGVFLICKNQEYNNKKNV